MEKFRVDETVVVFSYCGVGVVFVQLFIEIRGYIAVYLGFRLMFFKY